MSDHIPFEIQSEIIKRLPVKSLLQSRSVSKLWKSFIDDPKFIKNYHINQTNPQHCLLLRSKLDNVQTYTSIIDNSTFPQQKFPLTAPESLRLLTETLTHGSVCGLLCFHGDLDPTSEMVVLWNPTVRKSVAIVMPHPKVGCNVVSLGVCPDTRDPKLVKINIDHKSSMWLVEVFTLSRRVWRTVYRGAPFKLCENLAWNHVFVNGVIYFLAGDDVYLSRAKSNYIILFDLKSEKFGEVCLPERLLHANHLNLSVTNVNESLGLLEYRCEGKRQVCDVWSMKDGANKPFTKLYTIKVEGKSLFRVLGFRNNGEVIISVVGDGGYEVEVYDPFSGHTNGFGINGNPHTFRAWSYMETLLLLDESDAIIH